MKLIIETEDGTVEIERPKEQYDGTWKCIVELLKPALIGLGFHFREGEFEYVEEGAE